MASSPAAGEAGATSPAAAGEGAKGSTKRLDTLNGVAEQVRALWDIEKPFECESGAVGDEKYFVTFPIPYMNGRLHLGHAFSLTKSEFTARFQRLAGKNVLWPFGFHCTGMPIKASADRIRNELEDAKNGVVAQEASPVEESQEVELKAQTFGSKKSKTVAKTGNAKTQSEILLNLGVPPEEIPKFADSEHWLNYFPPIGKLDLNEFGLGVDWRRTFVTTDANKYFDKFIQWQFRTLLARDRIKFGLRPAVYSRLDQQPNADHDRAAGEGANPQEYTLIKMKVNKVPESWIEKAPQLKDKKIYLVAATLRPETMYGQTNCFVLPDGVYGVFPAFEKKLDISEIQEEGKSSFVACKTMTADEVKSSIDSYFVCAERAANNMSHQGILPLAPLEAGQKMAGVHRVCELTGREIIGVPLHAPLAIHEEVYALPLPSIKMDKGSGVVTSVPSDSADDYAMLKDLQDKEVIRKAYDVKLEWCQKDIVEMINIPGIGTRSAPDLCIQRKVGSWKDEIKLKEIKAELYLKAFYEGVLIIGPHAGTPVKDAKEIIKKELIASGDALSYYEPEKKVISRSGDECVVALCNQWYSDFGAADWSALVAKHVSDPESFEAYGQRAAYERTVDWLEGWACSRSFGLGTLLPWEKEQGNHVLIESLSDSTIYFAYYTIAHFLHKDMYGVEPGSMGLSADDLNDEIFDYVFCQTDVKPSCLAADKLEIMRHSFEYWYPMNLRCSGKDLVQNHLTMALFHHAAMWPTRPDLWPRGYFINGHLMLDSEKMSKSTGNFLSLTEALEQFSADGTRVALADAGDSVDDANFERATAIGALMRLFIFIQFVEEMIKKREANELRKGDKNHTDMLVENRLVDLSERVRTAYEKMLVRDALKYSFFEFLTLKDTYRNILHPEMEFHEETIFKWIEWQALVLSPIACYTCEYVWTMLLKKDKLIVKSLWPTKLGDQPDPIHLRQFEALLSFVEDSRKGLEKSTGKKKVVDASKKPNKMFVFIAGEYPEDRQVILRLLQKIKLDPQTNLPQDVKWIEQIRSAEEIKSLDKKSIPTLMGFATFRMKFVSVQGPSALTLSMPYDELEFFESYREFIARSLGLDKVEFIGPNTPNPEEDPEGIKRITALPGAPSVMFVKC